MVLCFICLIGYSDKANGETLTKDEPYAILQDRLIRDGFERSHIRSLYSRPEMTLDQRALAAYFSHREATLNYDQFLTRSSIDQAIDYLGQHQKAFKQTQSVYGVEEEVITAIILVESRLGTFIGKRLVLNTLSALAALDDKDSRDMLWHTYVRHKARGSRSQFDQWARRKSAWAYGELKAFLQHVKAQKVDPFSVYGSYAGALGIAQFVPSSVLRFAQDGNQDGQINLCDHEDAIESIANYLKQHGWRPGLKRREAFRILLYYNHSKYYAETILKVAERLGKLRPR
ncbi:MAG: lytic murein transglycosylase [Desulfobacterales bacterium]|nr:lytic murein transglycosylase [Desulfobacterales bacterium]